MRHADTNDFVRLVADEPDVTRRAEVETHLSGCEACRAEHRRFLATHRMLGEWTVEAGGRDVWAAAEQKLGLRAADRHLTIVPPRWRGVAAWSRAAAAIIIGIGLGHVIGRLNLPSLPLPAASAPTEQVAELVAADGLLLHALGSPSPAGLFTTVLAMLDPGPGIENGGERVPEPQPSGRASMRDVNVAAQKGNPGTPSPGEEAVP